MFFFVLALIGRSICNIGFISRPITLGFAWWLWTGASSPALPLAIFFELFWLDLYPIGSYLPPMAAFPYLLLLALSSSFKWIDPVAIVLPLAIALPLAYAVPYFEYRQRDLQKAASHKLVRKAEEGASMGALPGMFIKKSALQQLGLGLFFFLAAYTGIALVCSLVIQGRSPLISFDVNWTVLYAIAALGALLSLRIKRAYLIFGLCMAIMALINF